MILPASSYFNGNFQSGRGVNVDFWLFGHLFRKIVGTFWPLIQKNCLNAPINQICVIPPAKYCNFLLPFCFTKILFRRFKFSSGLQNRRISPKWFSNWENHCEICAGSESDCNILMNVYTIGTNLKTNLKLFLREQLRSLYAITMNGLLSSVLHVLHVFYSRDRHC